MRRLRFFLGADRAQYVAGRIRMAAAGHYIQDLQYRYLRTLLESFLVDRSEPWRALPNPIPQIQKEIAT